MKMVQEVVVVMNNATRAVTVAVVTVVVTRAEGENENHLKNALIKKSLPQKNNS